MPDFSPGDRIRIDIPDETDADHNQYHGREGTITDVLADDADIETGDRGDAGIYRIELDDGTSVDMRQRDLRPPLEE
jgi:ribosomal protein L21E